MRSIKLSVLALALSATGCKTVQASGTRDAELSSMEVSGSPEATPVAAGKTGKDAKADKEVLLRWHLGRYSLKESGTDVVEVKDKSGKLACEITESEVRKLLGAARLKELNGAIKTLSLSKGQTSRNPMFRGYDVSRELVALVGGEEFLIEMMFEVQEVLKPIPNKVSAKDFDSAMNTVMAVARDKKICPKAPE